MRSLAAAWLTLFTFTLAFSSASAQSGSTPDAGAPRVEPASASEPAPTQRALPSSAPAATPTTVEATAPEAQPPGTEPLPPSTLEPTEHAAAAQTAPVPSARETASAAEIEAAALRALWTSKVRHADAWVAFEAERDSRTRPAERVFFPLVLGVESALGVAYAVGSKDVPDTSRILAGTTAGLALAAALPSLLSRSRTARRAWFAAGNAVFSLGAGATIITAQDKDSHNHAARWVGSAVALQGLAFLPLALIPGFPDEADYEAYRLLPESERPDAAARLLARIDRFEQRATAISLFSALSGAIVMSVGAMVSDDREQSKTLAGLSLIPLGTIFALLAPRLFVRSRIDRYLEGEKPTKLPFNGW